MLTETFKPLEHLRTIVFNCLGLYAPILIWVLNSHSDLKLFGNVGMSALQQQKSDSEYVYPFKNQANVKKLRSDKISVTLILFFQG